MTATARPGDFDIQVVADTSRTTGQRDAVRAGVERWAQVIVNDLPDLRFEQGHMPTNHCRFILGDHHWRGDVLQDEIMSGWNHGASLSSNSPPLSAITVLSMVALGYDVDVSKADPYTVPAAGTAPVIAGRHVRGEPGSVGLMVDAIEIFDENGRLIGITYR